MQTVIRNSFPIDTQHSGSGMNGSRNNIVGAARQPEEIEPNEADLIRLAQQGDAGAFERIYRKHSRRVYALCLRMTGDHAQAEDLTQDTFLQVFRKIRTFRGEAAFSTWLHRIALNSALMRRRKKSFEEKSYDAISNPEDETDAPPRQFGGLDLGLEGLIDRITLEAAINELPPGYKAIFILHDVQGYDHSEIAQVFGRSIGNSKSQLHKARMRLRKLLLNPQSGTARHQRKTPVGSLVFDRLKDAFGYANS
jgi:RNA polymerase sigma-70 factor (ECF subfamily)